MSFRHRDLKLEVTVNGNGWDKPLRVSGNKNYLQPQTFNIDFPNGMGKNTSRLTLHDIVRVKAGFGDVDETPIFTGVIIDKHGKSPITYTFTSLLGLYEQPKVKLDDWDNLDGLECGYAIQKQLETYDFSNFATPMTYEIPGTNPVNVNPSSLRTSGSRLSLIKAINTLCVDETSLPGPPLNYAFYEIDTTFYHRKALKLDGTASAPYTYKTIDSISGSPRTTLTSLVTKCTVTGGTYTDEYGRTRNHEATHEDLSAIKLKRLFHLSVSDSSLTSYNQCLERAKLEVENGKFKLIGTTVKDLSLLHAIPAYSIMEVEKSKFDLDGIHQITDLTIALGNKGNNVEARINTAKPLSGGLV